LTDFSWVNQGTHSANQNASGSLTMFHPGAAGVGFNWGLVVKAIPTAPYSIITALTGHLMNNAQSLGFVLHDSASGKLIVYSIGMSDTGNTSIASWKMNSPTSYAGAYFTYNKPLVTGGLLPKFLRIRDLGNGVRTFAISQDNEVWLTVDAQLTTDFLTATHFGYGLRGTGSGAASIMTVAHEEITNP
jgi:hypothetical protein